MRRTDPKNGTPSEARRPRLVNNIPLDFKKKKFNSSPTIYFSIYL